MDNLVEKLFHEIEKAFLSSVRSLRLDNKVYACGFWLFYCDYTVISPPCFGYNSSYEEDDRWDPAEWEVDTDDTVYDAMSPFYEKLSNLMDGKPDESWEQLIEYQWQFYSNLCYKLNSEINSENSPFKGWSKSEDFVVGIFEQREGQEKYEELAIGSLGYEKAKDLCVI